MMQRNNTLNIVLTEGLKSLALIKNVIVLLVSMMEIHCL